MDCDNCLIGFSNNKSSHRISLKAIALLRIYEDHLAEGLVPGGALKPIDADADATFDMTEHYWFPMLAGLSDLTYVSRVEVRKCALEVLFDLLNERGRKLSSSFWESIFRHVLFPIFYQDKQAKKAPSIHLMTSGYVRRTFILSSYCVIFSIRSTRLKFLVNCSRSASWVNSFCTMYK